MKKESYWSVMLGILIFQKFDSLSTMKSEGFMNLQFPKKLEDGGVYECLFLRRQRISLHAAVQLEFCSSWAW